MQFTENFRHALGDYIFLLNKKYPEKTIHELVSTRYALNHFERSILYRGVTAGEKAEARKKKLITANRLSRRILHIDLFNVLFTIAAYLRGFPVYISMDGLLRDASEGHDSHEWVDHLYKALDLMMNYLAELNISRAIIYLDNPMHISSQVAQMIETRAHSQKIVIELIRHESPDHLIRSVTEGILATSDSTIIDKSIVPVFDLPRGLLENRFHKQFLNIQDF